LLSQKPSLAPNQNPEESTIQVGHISAFVKSKSDMWFSPRAERLFLDDASAVSEANGTTVPVSLDLGSSLSIQPSEESRSRVRRTRSAMGIQSISA
jgi:hypothetical protein